MVFDVTFIKLGQVHLKKSMIIMQYTFLFPLSIEIIEPYVGYGMDLTLVTWQFFMSLALAYLLWCWGLGAPELVLLAKPFWNIWCVSGFAGSDKWVIESGLIAAFWNCQHGDKAPRCWSWKPASSRANISRVVRFVLLFMDQVCRTDGKSTTNAFLVPSTHLLMSFAQN